MRRTTIKDVAALAGVSPATVSRTLDDRPEISAETKERVRAACAQLGYVPNAAAKGLTGQATHTLGVVVPDVSNPYFTGIATAIEETAAENGYRVLLSNSLQEEGRELRAIENFLARQIDGVLISPLSRESQAKHADLLEGTPCVYLGVNHGEKCSYVMADNEAGAAIAVRYLPPGPGVFGWACGLSHPCAAGAGLSPGAERARALRPGAARAAGHPGTAPVGL